MFGRVNFLAIRHVVTVVVQDGGLLFDHVVQFGIALSKESGMTPSQRTGQVVEVLHALLRILIAFIALLVVVWSIYQAHAGASEYAVPLTLAMYLSLLKLLVELLPK